MLKKSWMLIAFLLMISAARPTYAHYSCLRDSDKLHLDSCKGYCDLAHKFERSTGVHNVDVYFLHDTKQIECNLYNIGYTYIFVCDLNGTIVDSSQADTDLPTTVFLNADSCNRGFYVLIYSDRLCAEGCHLF